MKKRPAHGLPTEPSYPSSSISGWGKKETLENLSYSTSWGSCQLFLPPLDVATSTLQVNMKTGLFL